jgi:hypothetical protein
MYYSDHNDVQAIIHGHSHFMDSQITRQKCGSNAGIERKLEKLGHGAACSQDCPNHWHGVISLQRKVLDQAKEIGVDYGYEGGFACWVLDQIYGSNLRMSVSEATYLWC